MRKILCTVALAGALVAPTLAFAGNVPAGPGGGSGFPPGLVNALIGALSRGGNIPGALISVLGGGSVVLTLTPASGIPISNVAQRAAALPGATTDDEGVVEVDLDVPGGGRVHVVIDPRANTVTITKIA